MTDLLHRYNLAFGYTPTLNELYDLYTSGELSLTASDENSLLIAVGL